ncbi:DinB family protein [Halobacillus salinus]|uniref:DinB family protein n=1 Tax=Halobacillus salinus TaxID=192814 RepID=A0A4Z0H0U9_9BACI|nr:DinB family protein [Halobacillus salinus]TGB03599.1 DinB family protein [Halobacillus salinus]
MSRNELLLNVLDSTFDKEHWYAPFKNATEGLTAEQATWTPSGESTKSIWENVNHLLYYKERLAVTMEGGEWKNDLDGDETFHLTDQPQSDEEWNQVVERAKEAHHRLRQVLSETSDSELESLEQKLLDIMLHDAYHTGQIIQLRKMQGSWPSNR